MQMSQSECALGAIPGEEPGTISDQTLECPQCRYCLYGLPDQGVCPECGIRYETIPEPEKRAIEAFAHSVSRLLRLGLLPRSQQGFLGARRALLIFVVSAVSLAFPVLIAASSYVGFHLRSPEGGQVASGFSECGVYGMHGTKYLLKDGLAFLAMYTAFAVTLLVIATWLWWTWESRKSARLKHMLRDARLVACISTPLTLLPPMIVIAAWQVLNFIVKHRGSTRIHMPYIGTIVTWSADTLTIAGFLGAVAIGTISGVYLFRMQRRCIRGMRDEIRGVRIVHDACDEQ